MPCTNPNPSSGPSSSSRSGLLWPVVLWTGLAFAFAPTLADSFHHLVLQPWTRATLIFPVLALVAARAERPCTASRSGWVLILLGISIQLLAIGGGLVRVGRIGFVLAAIGLCRGAGWCSLPAALLLGFLLPLPHAVLELGSPWLEGGLAQVAAFFAAGLGFEVVPGRDVLTSAGATLRLADHDGGLGLAVLFAGLAWFDWQRSPRRSLRRLLFLAGLCVLAAGAVQVASLTISALVLAIGGKDAAGTARAILDGVPWILTWISGIVLALRHRRGGVVGGRDPVAEGVPS